MGAVMKRRRVLTQLGAAALGWPLVARAQQPDRVRRLGLLLPYIQSDPAAQARVSAYTAALQDLGWMDGHTSDRCAVLHLDLFEQPGRKGGF